MTTLEQIRRAVKERHPERRFIVSLHQHQDGYEYGSASLFDEGGRLTHQVWVSAAPDASDELLDKVILGEWEEVPPLDDGPAVGPKLQRDAA
jgi:hypothetical protein